MHGVSARPSICAYVFEIAADWLEWILGLPAFRHDLPKIETLGIPWFLRITFHDAS
jgi:hypothetical protein